MDPISLGASIIALFQVTTHLSGKLIRYAHGVKGAKSQAQSLMEEIHNFQQHLLQASSLLQEESENPTGATDRLKALGDTLKAGSPLIKNVEDDIAKISSRISEDETQRGSSLRNQAKVLLEKLKWPLKEEEINKLKDDMNRIQTQIISAQNIDNTQMLKNVDSTTKTILSSLKAGEVKQQTKEEEKKRQQEKDSVENKKKQISAWLRHANQEESHEVAVKARSESSNTGRWFLDGDTFAEWKASNHSLLWLHGNPGCGKTVLSSTIIENLRESGKSDGKIALAFWYFTAGEKAKTNASDCARSLITQLMRSFPSKVPGAIEEFWNDKKNQIPKASELTSTLKRVLVEEESSFFVVLDALDEVNEEETAEVFNILHTLLNSELSDVHVLVTSRQAIKERFEAEVPEHTTFYDIGIERAHVEEDIRSYVTEQLRTDPTLSKCDETLKAKISDTLLEKAEGMFRWVDCQLQALRKCKKRSAFERVLNTLPKNLEEQYKRELLAIGDPNEPIDVLNLLKWLTYPRRKLRVDEVVDVLAVNYDDEEEEDELTFDPSDKYTNPGELVALCGSLVRVEHNEDGKNHLGEASPVDNLTTSHNTVLEFLKSQPIKVGDLEEVRLSNAKVNRQMALTSLAYLTSLFHREEELTVEKLAEYPAARLCAELWDDYYREAISDPRESVDLTRLNEMVIHLLDTKTEMLKWVQICDPDNDNDPVDLDRSESILHSPLYYAALLGLPDIVKHYISEGEDVNLEQVWGIGSPLGAAAFQNRIEVVKILLEAGASIDSGGTWQNGKAIAIAVAMDTVEILKMFMEQEEFDVDAQRYDWKCDTTQVEVNGESQAPDGEDDPKNDDKLALENKTDQDGEALKDSSEGTDEDKTEETGATEGSTNNTKDDNIEESGERAKAGTNEDKDETDEDDEDDEDEGDTTESPETVAAPTDDTEQRERSSETLLYIAARYASPEALDILLDAGADVNKIGGSLLTPLNAAGFAGSNDVVEKLLERGAKVDVYGGKGDSALVCACYGQIREDLVCKIVDQGCAVKKGDAEQLESNPLYIAVLYQTPGVVRYLLEKGGEVNDRGNGDYDNCLQAACGRGDEDIVKLLLENGADMTMQGAGKYDNCLEAAVVNGFSSVVKILLEAGMSPNIKGGVYAYPIVAAAFQTQQNNSTWDPIFQSLLTHGADPYAYQEVVGDYDHCMAIQKLESTGAIDIFHEHGVDLNKATEEYVNLLSSRIITDNNLSVIEHVLGKGVDVNALHDRWGRPLTLACRERKLEAVRRLLKEESIDINAVNEYSHGSALHLAASNEFMDIVQILVEANADINVDHWLFGTPFLESKSDEIQEYLYQRGADLAKQNFLGQNALHRAAVERRFDFADRLLSWGVATRVADKFGATILHYAARAGDLKAVRKFLDWGLDLNAQDNYGWTALHWACASNLGTASLIRELLSRDIRTRVKDIKGRTALDYAIGFHKAEEAAVLQNPGLDLEAEVTYSFDGRMASGVWSGYHCDGCSNGRGNRYNCKTCHEYDLCFHCYEFKDTVHKPDHEFEVQEEQTLFVDDGKSAESTEERPETLTVESSEGQSVTSKGRKFIFKTQEETGHVPIYAKADKPLSTKSHYFEMKVLKLPETYSAIGIGLATEQAGRVGMAGWNTGSYGYHNDDGKFFVSGPFFETEETYGAGDVVGCGISRLRFGVRAVFFTKNGKSLGRFIVPMETGPLYPVVSGFGDRVSFRVNFGTKDFLWNDEESTGIMSPPNGAAA